MFRYHIRFATPETNELASVIQRLPVGARFENAPAPETIGPDGPSSFRSQSLTGVSEAGKEPIETDRPR